MSLHLQPVRVRTGSSDFRGQLVFAAGFLVAVLVQLSDDHGDESGMWFLEAGFGSLDHPPPPTFSDLDEAEAWISQRITARPLIP